LKPKRIVAEAYSKHLRELWKVSWKTTVQDLLFRNALHRNDLIDDPISDEPWNWRCWITDFVKRGQVTKSWADMEPAERNRIISHGAELLREELKVLCNEPNPVKCVVFIGKESKQNFETYLEDQKWPFEKKLVKHYSWAKSESQENEFHEIFKKAIDEYRLLGPQANSVV
jgi:hypothetical protein